MFEQSTIVLYVQDLVKSQNFYHALLGINPENLSPSFTSFTLSNGLALGLKDKRTVHPEPEGHGGGELAFTVSHTSQVDQLFFEWTQKGATILEPPINLPFAYTFLASDPDGNRLRVAALKGQ